jgi:uncharacterized protein YlxW (UPF0749 family)
MMRTRSATATLTATCLVLGVLLMTQFRTQGTLATATVADSPADQATIIANLANANDELRREEQSLARQEAEYRRSLAEDDLRTALADLHRLRVITGESEVAGPGIEIRVERSIRSEEVQDMINELRNAGAEAFAVNGRRVVAWSAVAAVGGKPGLDGNALEVPIVFEAIGDPDALDRAVGRTGGLVSYLESTYPDAKITLSKRDKLTLWPAAGEVRFPTADVVR